ncbi:hypothetical protein JW877_03220 [bacterium]|nr:hypothetical protein [bacterium]
MNELVLILSVALLDLISLNFAQEQFERDTISTASGSLVMTFIGQCTLMFEFDEKVIQTDYAFLPMNLPYTMSAKMVVDAVNLFHPQLLYPCHYGGCQDRRTANPYG